MNSALQQLKALPRTERIKLVQELWDQIASEDIALELPEPHRVELERRLALRAEHPVTGKTLEQIAEELRVKL